MKKLCVIGPYDRYNYGDLLFAHIIEKCLGDSYDELEYYSTSTSKMSIYGGKDTISSSEILKQKENFDVIIAGGESVGVTWGTLASFNFKRYSKLRKYILRIPKINCYIDNLIGKHLFKGKTISPLLITHKDFPRANKIFYNSLGGRINSLHKKNKKFIRELNNIDYVAIRDTDSLKSFKEVNNAAILVPDSAIIMSEFYSIDFLRSKASQNMIDFIDNSKYFVFQINYSIGQNIIEECINVVNNLCKEKNLKVAFCTIGYAYLHEDFIPLRKIRNGIKYENALFDNNNIWDIMYLIANSQFYIGTSLHGAITAMSFKIPYFGLYINKLNYYLKDWGIDKLNRTYTINEITDIINQIDIKSIKDDLNINYQNQKKLVLDSFEKMRKISNI